MQIEALSPWLHFIWGCVVLLAFIHLPHIHLPHICFGHSAWLCLCERLWCGVWHTPNLLSMPKKKKIVACNVCRDVFFFLDCSKCLQQSPCCCLYGSLHLLDLSCKLLSSFLGKCMHFTVSFGFAAMEVLLCTLLFWFVRLLQLLCVFFYIFFF